jgi:hypothetical protein
VPRQRASLSQVLHLANSNTVEGKIAIGNGRIAGWSRQNAADTGAGRDLLAHSRGANCLNVSALEYIAPAKRWPQGSGRRGVGDCQ